MEVLAVKCWPFYLLREFTAVFIFAIYIPLSASTNANEAIDELYGIISEIQTRPGDFIVARDFNHSSLRSVVPKFHTDFRTCGDNILGFVYINISGTYKAVPLLHLGHSYHISILLTPAYRPLQYHAGPVLRKLWTWGSQHQYISKCTEDVTTSKTVVTRANQKPWFTAEVQNLVKARDDAFKSGDREALSKTRHNLSRAIRAAKRTYAQRIHRHFSNSRDTAHVAGNTGNQ
ncbi:hypothetical protein LDENG_00058560 [Lucifuga dentata]|nr:hypothetical protein LDENG_00058560 [Lucifuga dentata]